MNTLRQKVLRDWRPLWDKFLKNDEPQSIVCKTEKEARELRMMYYRARLYCKEAPELYELYKKVLLERKACVEGCTLMFKMHTKLYLEKLLK